MAKIISPLPIGDLPAGFAEMVKVYGLGTLTIAARNIPLPQLTPEQIAEIRALMLAAQAAWDGLATWKKVRWSLCAIRTYGDAATLKGATGYSGYSVYMQAYLEQRTEAGKQPISPCSARATDPDASPWNYQP